jgi:hypothetical protein
VVFCAPEAARYWLAGSRLECSPHCSAAANGCSCDHKQHNSHRWMLKHMTSEGFPRTLQDAMADPLRLSKRSLGCTHSHPHGRMSTNRCSLLRRSQKYMTHATQPIVCDVGRCRTSAFQPRTVVICAPEAARYWLAGSRLECSPH